MDLDLDFLPIFAMLYTIQEAESTHWLGVAFIPKIGTKKPQLLTFSQNNWQKNLDSSEPKCGFSKQTVAILEGLKADYGTFDILADEDVRQVGYSTDIFRLLIFLHPLSTIASFVCSAKLYPVSNMENMLSRKFNVLNLAAFLDFKSRSTLLRFQRR